MRVNLLTDYTALTPTGKAGTWRDVEPDSADFLIAHGNARSDSGLYDRQVIKRARRARRGSPDPAGPAASADRPKKSLADFLRAVERRDTYYIERHYNTTLRVADSPEPRRKAALGEASGPTGGYTVPPRFSRRIMALVNERAVLRRVGAQVLPMESATLQVPCLDVTTVQAAGTSPFFGGLTLNWTGESLTRTETEPGFREMELKAWELSGTLTLSRPLFDDGTGTALDAFLTTVIAEAVAWTEDFAFLQGNGVGKPQGILTAPASLAVNRSAGGHVRAPALALILSPSQRQSGETFRKIRDAYNALGRPACASLNASVCADNPPRLYAVTRNGEPVPKCPTSRVTGVREKALYDDNRFAPWTKNAIQVDEVLAHPLVDLLNRPNPYHGSFDLWELTTLYQEVHGTAFWSLDYDPVFGVPRAVYVLPSQNVTPMRSPDSPRPIDFYRYRTGRAQQDFEPDRIIFFRYPDPRDPYTAGLSPLRAAFEQVFLTSEYAAFKVAKFQNHGVPDAVVSPDEVIGEEERDRLETQWNQRFRRGGSGRVVVAESGLKIQLLQQSMGDFAALAEQNVTANQIANAFHVPVAFFTTSTNLANLQASRFQHAELAIGPRLTRRDETLNATLVPLFDPDGRLFLASDNPTPDDSDATVQQLQLDLQYGVFSINEVRAGRGLPPVPWGDQPWLNSRWAQADQLRDRGAPPLPGTQPAAQTRETP